MRKKFNKVDFDDVLKIADRNRRMEKIKEIIDACPEGDPLLLSDIILNGGREGGEWLIMLAEDEKEKLMGGEVPAQWKIQVVRDEWGNAPQPGDVVLKKTPKPFKDSEGKFKFSTDDFNIAKVTGEYDEKFVNTKSYKVDKKGCITCTFTDAVHYLNLWGLHAVTSRSMTTKPEHSTDVAVCPDGQKRHVWYWRYKEAPKELYEKLPAIKKRDETRGEDERENPKTN